MLKTFRYGTPYWGDQGDIAFREQLMLTKDLWNTAVTLEEEHELAKEAIWRDCPVTAAAWQQAQERKAEVAALYARAKNERQDDRSTRPRQGTSEEITLAKKKLGDALDELAAARQVAYPDLKAVFGELKLACAACQSRRSSPPDSLYKKYRKWGLGWGTVNDILQRRLPGAMKMIREEGGSLRRKAGDGTGTLTVQLQLGRGTKKGLLPTFGVLENQGSPWARDFRLTPSPWRPRGRGAIAPTRPGRTYYTARVRLSDRCVIDLPLVLHRPIPAEGVIKEVKVTRFRIGLRYRMSICLVVQLPDPPPPAEGGIRFLQPRWTADRSAGGILTATIGSTTPLPAVPHDLRNFVRLHEGALSAEVFLPDYFETVSVSAEARQQRRFKAQHEIRQLIMAQLASNPSLEQQAGTSAAALAQTTRAGTLYRLVRRWPQGHAFRPVLEEWVKSDIHRHEAVANEIDQLNAHRRDAWKKVASWLCEKARTVTLADTPVAKLRQAPPPGEEDGQKKSRQQMQGAAPGELRLLAETAARMRGIRVLDVKPGILEPA